MKIGIINYGTGNIYSIANALNELSASYVVINKYNEITQVDALILPGVGSFAESKKKLDKDHWTDQIIEAVTVKKKSLLGICLGMQLLADSSTEGAEELEVPGLGLIPGKVVHLSEIGCNLRVPHVGWNSVSTMKDDKLFKNISNNTDFYFVHSYVFSSTNNENVIAQSEYGVPFAVAISKDRTWGTQFHPEKSSKAGFLILQNFISHSLC